tara:strand:+ start:312 stop:659 length:348 start_codon:yes stop_codon:yes gene_type:complete
LREKQNELLWLPDLLEELQALRNEYRDGWETDDCAYCKVSAAVIQKDYRVKRLNDMIELTDFYYEIPWTMFNVPEMIKLRINIFKGLQDDISKGKIEDLFLNKMAKDLALIEDSH